MKFDGLSLVAHSSVWLLQATCGLQVNKMRRIVRWSPFEGWKWRRCGWVWAWWIKLLLSNFPPRHCPSCPNWPRSPLCGLYIFTIKERESEQGEVSVKLTQRFSKWYTLINHLPYLHFLIGWLNGIWLWIRPTLHFKNFC